MTNLTVWKIVASAALALICILLVQGYWLVNAYNLNNRAFEEKVHICLRNVAEQMAHLQQVQLPALGVVNQISDNYFVVNIRDAIDANNLEYYLRKEFETVSLPVDFEYGIYDCDTDQMVYGNHIGYQDQTVQSNLPTYDDFVYYFGVRFPNRSGYILKDLWIPIFFTAILVLAIIFFIYATYGILKQKKLSELQKDFINNMTHEFKTPLTSIQISSEVFLNDPVVKQHPRLHRYAGIINDQTDRLTQQIERVLQIARWQKSKLALKLERVELHAAIIRIVDQLQGRIEKEHVTMELNLASKSFTLSADQLHLSNVIYGLLDNAMKYSSDSPEIKIRTEADGELIKLVIIDHGIGISPDHIKLLGQKFFRVPTKDIHNAKGFGLGLHYIRQVIDLHGWKMQIDSQPNQGTSVTVFIPNT